MAVVKVVIELLSRVVAAVLVAICWRMLLTSPRVASH